MQSLIALGKALSDPIGVRILAVIAETPCGLSRLSEALGVDRSTLRTRLERLVASGCLSSRKEGREYSYRVSKEYAELVSVILKSHRDEIEWDYSINHAKSVLMSEPESIDLDRKLMRK